MLAHEIGKHEYYLIDCETLHPMSVRIGSNSSEGSAYIYTYAQEKERYGVHLEYPYRKELNLSEQEEMYDDLDYKALLEMLKVHFHWIT
jgi:hypothetical protein